MEREQVVKLFDMKTSKIKWYLYRLSKMSPQEIGYRISQVVKHYCDKMLYPRFLKLPECDQLNSTSLFKLSTSFLEDKSLISEILEKADKILHNQFDVFGIKIDYGEKIDWHLDPKTKRRWPLKFWADIDIRDGFTIGGVKFVWEINRFYFFPILGLAYQLTKKKCYADKIFDLLFDWMKANPYPIGVNWTSGIELAIRIANLLWTLSFLKDYTFTSDQKLLINQFIYLHAFHLIRYPSKYSSNNNHAIAEAFGLFLAGLYFKHLKGAHKWYIFGKKVLDRELMRQILPDGGSIECTTTYLSFVLDFLLLYVYICKKENISYPKELNDRLLQSCNFIQTIMDKNGNIPNIGDQDSAILVNFGLDNYENFKSILNSTAVFFKRRDLCADNYPDIKTQILFGKEVKRINKISKKTKSHLFGHTGLAVIKEEYKGKEVIFIGNFMPLGMAPLCAHGHLDALSFTLSVDGYEIFIDPGTYLYHDGGKWRRYFRSTAAHNTIRINEQDSVRQIADFMFDGFYRVESALWEDNEKEIKWKAWYDAYLKRYPYVKHTRYVRYFKKEGKFIIADFLESENEYIAEWFFHLHPKCFVSKHDCGKVVIKRKSVKIELVNKAFENVKIVYGQQNPLLGWYSRHFNHLQKTNTITWKMKCKGNINVFTEIRIIMERKQ